MFRFIFCLILFFSVSLASDFQYYKKKFLNMSSSQVVNYLCDYNKNNNPYRNVKSDYFNYTYYCYTSKGIYLVKIKPDDRVDILNYKKLNKFVNSVESGITSMVCNNSIFKASLYSSVRLEFEIYDSRDNLQSKFSFSKNSSPACTFY